MTGGEGDATRNHERIACTLNNERTPGKQKKGEPKMPEINKPIVAAGAATAGAAITAALLLLTPFATPTSPAPLPPPAPPPIQWVQDTLSRNPRRFRPEPPSAVCGDPDTSRAKAWGTGDYAYLADRCDLIHDWLANKKGLSPTEFLCQEGFDSSAFMTPLTFDPSSRGDIKFTFHGKTYASSTVDPVTHKITVTVPCWKDRYDLDVVAIDCTGTGK